ncbi:MAG: hypothetical protein D6712_15570 [Chloroflexi bacterium]|nr:MAG: hypothetical protein D6712_15570 [Chloroflexota bacterium]
MSQQPAKIPPSTIGRPIDLRYASNVYVTIVTVVALIVGGLVQLLQTHDFGQSMLYGGGIGLSAFFAWALARELDPDYNRSAVIAALLAPVALLLYGMTANLLPLFLIMLAIRVLNRSTGLPPTLLDRFAILVLLGLVVYAGHWLAGIFALLFFITDMLLARAFRQSGWWIGSAITVFVLTFLIGRNNLQASTFSDTNVLITALLSAIILVALLLAPKRVTSVGDLTNAPLNFRRIHSARWLTLSFVVAYSVLSGETTVLDVIPLWASLLGFAINALLWLKLLSRRLANDASR